MAATLPRLFRGNYKHLLGLLILSASAAASHAADKNPPPRPAPARPAAVQPHMAGPMEQHAGPGGVHPGPGGVHEGMMRHDAPHYAFRDHDVRHFGHDDLVRWRGGRWNQTCFDGRCGWWWFAGGQWYFYDTPVYPYPVVVSEVAYVEPVAAAPVVVAPPPIRVAAPPKLYYYCDNPRGYYPQVANCNTEFRQVAAPPN
jgi:hypothetical protein